MQIRFNRTNPGRRILWILLALGIVPFFSYPATAQQTPQTKAQAYTLPPDKLVQATALGYIRTSIHFGAEIWQLAFLVLLLSTGRASRLARWSSHRTTRPWLQAAIFSAMLAGLLFCAVDLPVSAIGHAFSRHYNISVQPWPSWLIDQAKALGLTVSLETPILMLVYGLMHWPWSRQRYWLWFSIAAVPIAVIGAFLLPQLVDPIFNTFEPLSQAHPALVVSLQQVVARTGTNIPPSRMFLMKASEKSNGLNAYVSGLGSSRRIVVWDTTADRMPTDQILFTFAHESGHYVLNHIPKGLTFGSIGLFFLFWLTSRITTGMIARWGIAWRIPQVSNLAGLSVLLLAFTILQILTEPIQSFASRYIEHQADVYGQEAIHGIVPDPRKTAVGAFNTLGEAYLDDPNPNPIVEFWTYDHPSIQSRANFAAHYDPWAEGQKPEFFQK
jgi:STE24 endopeptidase